MAHPVINFEIGGRDETRLSDFYSRLFGWDIQAAGPGYRLVPPQDGGIGGGLMKVRDAMQPYVTFYVQVEDLQASLDRAEELGGKRVVEPTDIPGVGAFALFQDLDGKRDRAAAPDEVGGRFADGKGAVLRGLDSHSRGR